MFFYTFFPKILNMSLTAGVAVLAILPVRLLLKRAPKVISYALWGVVLIRLLCPVAPGSRLSLFGLMDAPVASTGGIEYISPDIVHTRYPSVALPVPGIAETVNRVLPQGEEQLVADPLEAPMAAATYVWMTGALAMLVYAAVSYARLRRRLITASPLRGNIYLADEITSPFVMGLIRPRIYIPSSLDERERPYILAHEQIHIRRCDHIIKALAFAALCVHWFNPLVWAAFILATRDMEMSCDEAVVRKMGPGILADYSSSLLSLATGRRIIAGTPLAFGEGDARERIVNLAGWKKPAVWAVTIGVLVCGVLAVCLLTNPDSSGISLEFAVPAGSGGVVYAEEEISPRTGYITVSSGEGLGDTQVFIEPVEADPGTAYDSPQYLTPGMPVRIEAERGGWFRIGVNVQNSTDKDITVYVNVDGVRVRAASDGLDGPELYRTDYVGDAPKVSQIAQRLPYPGDYRYSSIELRTAAEPYGLMIRLTGSGSAEREDFEAAASLAFELIGNLGTVSFWREGEVEPMAAFERGALSTGS